MSVAKGIICFNLSKYCIKLSLNRRQSFIFLLDEKAFAHDIILQSLTYNFLSIYLHETEIDSCNGLQFYTWFSYTRFTQCMWYQYDYVVIFIRTPFHPVDFKKKNGISFYQFVRHRQLKCLKRHCF